MANRDDVIIYMKYVKLDVVIPENYVWEFMQEFGEKFAIEDIYEGTSRLKAVDGYYNHPGGWHIQVTVFENYESNFYDFLQEFCTKRQLSFRQP